MKLAHIAIHTSYYHALRFKEMYVEEDSLL